MERVNEWLKYLVIGIKLMLVGWLAGLILIPVVFLVSWLNYQINSVIMLLAYLLLIPISLAVQGWLVEDKFKEWIFR